MRCDLCQREFQREEAKTSCKGCLSSQKCSGVRCPHCFYEMVPKPAWVEKIASWFRKKEKQKKSHEIPLTALSAYSQATVARLGDCEPKQLNKMIALGVLPGTEIELIQKFPTYLFQVSESFFSMDHELASLIRVKPL